MEMGISNHIPDYQAQIPELTSEGKGFRHNLAQSFISSRSRVDRCGRCRGVDGDRRSDPCGFHLHRILLCRELYNGRVHCVRALRPVRCSYHRSFHLRRKPRHWQRRCLELVDVGFRQGGLSGLAVAMFTLTFLAGYTGQTALEVFFLALGILSFFTYFGMAVTLWSRRD